MNNDNTLKRALAANAVFSGMTGIASLAVAGPLTESLGPPAWALRALGAGLIGFAAIVGYQARGPRRAGTRLIIAADVLWVVAAATLIGVAPTWLTGTGRVALAAVTLVVGTVAAAQWRGLESAS